MEKIELLKQYIKETNNIVFFGGAGVSTESGIPDFRSKDGLYNQHDVRFENYQPEYLLSHSCLMDNPRVFYEFYRQKMDTRNIHPNDAHYFLTKLEKIGKLKAIVTQNIDGLHQEAGNENVLEIHGSTHRNYCMQCGKFYPENYIFESNEDIPKCQCGGMVRCAVTLYEEALPDIAVYKAVQAIKNADMLIIGGTSLTVYPASTYVRYFRGKHLVIINKTHIDYPINKENDLEINEPIGSLFRQLMDEDFSN